MVKNSFSQTVRWIRSDAWRDPRKESPDRAARCRILDGALLIEPEPGAEGVATIEASATDPHGQTATIRFEVRVEFHWPTNPTRGWRSVILNSQR